jgi:hypothetical protein
LKEKMLDYGRGGNLAGPYGQNNFAAMPKVISNKNKYKDPYGPGKEE